MTTLSGLGGGLQLEVKMNAKKWSDWTQNWRQKVLRVEERWKVRKPLKNKGILTNDTLSLTTTQKRPDCSQTFENVRPSEISGTSQKCVKSTTIYPCVMLRSSRNTSGWCYQWPTHGSLVSDHWLYWWYWSCSVLQVTWLTLSLVYPNMIGLGIDVMWRLLLGYASNNWPHRYHNTPDIQL